MLDPGLEPSPQTATRRMMVQWNAGDYDAIARHASERSVSMSELVRRCMFQFLRHGDTLDGRSGLGSPTADTQSRNISHVEGSSNTAEIVESETDEEIADPEKDIKHDLRDIRRIEKEAWITYFASKRKGTHVASVRSLSLIANLKETKAKVRVGLPKKQVESQPAELEELKARLVRVLMKHPAAMQDVMEELERGGQKQIGVEG